MKFEILKPLFYQIGECLLKFTLVIERPLVQCMGQAEEDSSKKVKALHVLFIEKKAQVSSKQDLIFQNTINI